MIRKILIVNNDLLRKKDFKIEIVDSNTMVGVNKEFVLAYDCQKMLIKVTPHNKLNINNFSIKFITNLKRNIKTSNSVWSSEYDDKCIKIRIHKTNLNNIEASKLILSSL